MSELPAIALVQMDVTPGHPERNVERMLARMGEARGLGAEVVVFSELCIPGYFLGDLWEMDRLVEDFESWSEVVREASEGITVLFGNVVLERDAIGEDGRIRKLNAVRVCHDRRWVERAGLPPGLPPGAHPKTLHPNYRFFDDDRHFYSVRKLAQARGRPVWDWMVPFEVPTRRGRLRFGVQLCEDLWAQDYGYEGEVLNTARAYRDRGAQCIFNLSASPWTWQKNEKRHRTVGELLAGAPLPFFYVNCVGAQNNGKNILVFDGDTTAYGPDGSVLARAPDWEEALLLVPPGPGGRGGGPGAVPPGGGGADPGELTQLHRAVVAGIRHLDRIREQENRFLIGVSGGIDSSLVASLLTESAGPERVLAVNMPTHFNSALTRDNARALCERLGLEYLSLPIEDTYHLLSRKIREARFPRTRGRYTGLVDENLQARIRGSDILAGLAAAHGAIFTNNGNKTETALGYATLYGDVDGAIAPIADLWKTQVFALARHLNDEVFAREVIPANLYDGSLVPSAELSEAQDVTRGLGDPIHYGYHDAVLRQMVEYRRHRVDLLRWWQEGRFFREIGWEDRERFLEWFPEPGQWLRDLAWLERQLRVSYFKRIQAPPIIVLSKRAFGFDLRESQLPAYEPRELSSLQAPVADLSPGQWSRAVEG